MNLSVCFDRLCQVEFTLVGTQLSPLVCFSLIPGSSVELAGQKRGERYRLCVVKYGDVTRDSVSPETKSSCYLQSRG